VRSQFPCGDVRYILAADEDFSTHRPTARITTGANAGFVGAGEFSWTVPLTQKFPNGIEGPTVFGGSGCVEDLNGNGISDRNEVPLASTIPTPAGQTPIVVFERGTCFFSIKVESGQLRGYQVVVIGNHHAGSVGGLFPNSFICGAQGHDFTATASGVCIGHAPMHRLFNDPVSFTGPSTGAGADIVPIGTVGANLRVQGGVFDGWGYLHLYNADTMAEIDQYAVREALDERFATGFGDLTIHEVTTDPTGSVGYIAWYSAGFRVVDYSGGTLEEVGHYVDPAGSDIWGVELNVRADGRLFALASDRSYGLQIFRFGTDLRPTKVSSPRTTRVGSKFTYSIRVANNGTIAETNTVVRDRLPRGVQFVSASATQGTCTYRRATRTVVCNLGRVVNDAGAAFVNITVRATRTGTFRNTAVVAGIKAEYDIGNNTARATTRVRPAPAPRPRPPLTGRSG
jgi:uncharacterized repeat protein (TIGR01451 family)